MKHLIISDNPRISSEILAINKELGVSDLFDFGISPFSNAEHWDFPVQVYDLREDSVIEKLRGYDLIISCHCKQIFPVNLIDEHTCYNLHPGYNPINRGWYPQVFAIINEVPVGATLHKIDAKLDHGDIVDRAFVEKNSSDTSFTLYNRIVEMELQLWRKNILNILNGEVELFPPEGEGNMYLKKDFNRLKVLDLNHVGTLEEHIRLLRALTFDKYKNAYFLNDDGSKVYVNIQLEDEETASNNERQNLTR